MQVMTLVLIFFAMIVIFLSTAILYIRHRGFGPKGERHSAFHDFDEQKYPIVDIQDDIIGHVYPTDIREKGNECLVPIIPPGGIMPKDAIPVKCPIWALKGPFKLDARMGGRQLYTILPYEEETRYAFLQPYIKEASKQRYENFKLRESILQLEQELREHRDPDAAMRKIDQILVGTARMKGKEVTRVEEAIGYMPPQETPPKPMTSPTTGGQQQ